MIKDLPFTQFVEIIATRHVFDPFIIFISKKALKSLEEFVIYIFYNGLYHSPNAYTKNDEEQHQKRQKKDLQRIFF